MDEEQSKKYKSIAIVLIVAAVAVVAGWWMYKEDIGTGAQINMDCCSKICAGIGPGVTCDSVFNDQVKCLLPYAQYGKPEISEVFTFKVVDKDKACG